MAPAGWRLDDPAPSEFFATELVVVFPVRGSDPKIRGLSLSPLFLLVFDEDWDIFWLKDYPGVWKPLIDCFDRAIWFGEGPPVTFECDFEFFHGRERIWATLLEARSVTHVTV
jgi:hypothetical protein